MLNKKFERAQQLINAGWQKHKACKQAGITVGYYNSECAKRQSQFWQQKLVDDKDPIVIDAEVLEPTVDDETVEVDLGDKPTMVAPTVVIPTQVDKTKLAKAVYNYRIKNNLSQQAMAELIGFVNGSSISSVEMQKNGDIATKKFLDAVVKVITIDDLLKYADMEVQQGLTIKGVAKDYKAEYKALKQAYDELEKKYQDDEREIVSTRNNISVTMSKNNKLQLELEQALKKIAELQNQLAKSQTTPLVATSEEAEKLKLTIVKLKDERDRYKKIVDKLIA